MGTHITLLLQNQKIVKEASSNLLSQLPLMSLIDVNKNIRLINKGMAKGPREHQKTSQLGRHSYMIIKK